MSQETFPGDEDKSESYIRRRNLLLSFMRNQKWDEPNESKPSKPRGRKPAPPKKPQIDLTKPRNKFFKYESDTTD